MHKMHKIDFPHSPSPFDKDDDDSLFTNQGILTTMLHRLKSRPAIPNEWRSLVQKRSWYSTSSTFHSIPPPHTSPDTNIPETPQLQMRRISNLEDSDGASIVTSLTSSTASASPSKLTLEDQWRSIALASAFDVEPSQKRAYSNIDHPPLPHLPPMPRPPSPISIKSSLTSTTSTSRSTSTRLPKSLSMQSLKKKVRKSILDLKTFFSNAKLNHHSDSHSVDLKRQTSLIVNPKRKPGDVLADEKTSYAMAVTAISRSSQESNASSMIMLHPPPLPHKDCDTTPPLPRKDSVSIYATSIIPLRIDPKDEVPPSPHIPSPPLPSPPPSKTCPKSILVSVPRDEMERYEKRRSRSLPLIRNLWGVGYGL